MSDSLFTQHSNSPLIGLPDGGELGSMALEASIHGSPFTLIYRARDDFFDGSGEQIARGIVNFAKKYNCQFALLVNKNCWIAEARGLSIAAQFEDDAELQNYRLVVVPLDQMIYVADVEDGLVVNEKVYPIDRALEYLRTQRNDSADSDNIAILKGGIAAKPLQDEGFVVNHDHDIVCAGKIAENFRYQSLNVLLLKHRLYHHRLLVPAAGIASLLLSIAIFLYYYNNDDTKVIVEQKIEQIQQVVVEVKPNYLNNQAAQMLRQARTWILSPSIDFLSTCRLTSITLDKSGITYRGQWMDELELDREGCGNQRLITVVQQKQQLRLFEPESGWGIRTQELPIEVDSISRVPTQQTLYQLELLADYIGWNIDVQSIDSDGDDRDIQLVLRGDQLTAGIINYLIAKFMALPARIQHGRIEYDPESLNLIKAELYITLFTVGEHAQ